MLKHGIHALSRFSVLLVVVFISFFSHCVLRFYCLAQRHCELLKRGERTWACGDMEEGTDAWVGGR